MKLEPLLVGGERADTRLKPIADHQNGVGGEEGRNLRFVGLQLGVGAPDGGAFIGGVLELDQAQGQAIEKHHHVGAATVLAIAHGELVHHQPVVGADLSEVDQLHMIAGDAAIGPWIFHRHPFPQQAVKGAVGLQQGGHRQAQHLAQGLLPCLLRNGGVEPLDGLAQTAHQHHLTERLSLRRRFAGSQLGASQHGVAQLLKPAEGGSFDVGFGKGHGVGE